MNFSEISEKYNAELATIVNHNDWVKAEAREIELESELHLAEELDKIMKCFMKIDRFAGISSNNIYWNLTEMPIRVMYIPINGKEYITLINPKILKLAGKDMHCVEGCGSIPDDNYLVQRKSYVYVAGYNLEKEYIELEYDARDYNAGEEPLLLYYNHRGIIVQHEMDHLDGITIKDKGTLFDLSSLMVD